MPDPISTWQEAVWGFPTAGTISEIYTPSPARMTNRRIVIVGSTRNISIYSMGDFYVGDSSVTINNGILVKAGTSKSFEAESGLYLITTIDYQCVTVVEGK